tara:strand:- start:85 stop:291 length:207 start_codon:yes stop_codon:yes gene_type:complete
MGHIYSLLNNCDPNTINKYYDHDINNYYDIDKPTPKKKVKPRTNGICGGRIPKRLTIIRSAHDDFYSK